MDYEEVIIQIIGVAGSARSFAMEALASAQEGEFNAASASLDQARSSLLEAHDVHASLLALDARGELAGAGLLAMHAEDQLMGAILVIDLAETHISALRRISDLEKRLNS